MPPLPTRTIHFLITLLLYFVDAPVPAREIPPTALAGIGLFRPRSRAGPLAGAFRPEAALRVGHATHLNHIPADSLIKKREDSRYAEDAEALPPCRHQSRQYSGTNNTMMA